MPTRIEMLKQGGFSDDEIGDWAVAERQRMQEAGFTNTEIDHEFGVTRPPREIPPAFIERLKQGNWLRRILDAAGEYTQRHFGDEPLGFSPENQEALKKLGIIGDIMIPAAKPIDALLRSVPAGIAGLGAGLGQIVEEGHDAALGPGPYAKGKAARDFAQLAQIAALLSGAKGPPTGSMRPAIASVGTGPASALPRAEDFRNAAAAISGTPASFHAEQKLLRLWKDHGISPTEVAGDARRDRTIAESITSESDRLPDAYVRQDGTTTDAQINAPKSAESGPPNGATAPQETTTAVTEAGQPAPNLSVPEPAHMLAESKDVSLFDPPQQPERPFDLDYYGQEFRTNSRGRLLSDIEGRPLGARFIVGRQFYGKPDRPLSPKEIKRAMKLLDIEFAAVDPTTLEGGAIGSYRSTKTRYRPAANISVSNLHSQSDQDLLAAHEFGHAIDHFAGMISDVLTPAEMHELRRVYGTLRSGSEGTSFRRQPENFGYPRFEVGKELVAEGIRAYMANPNYFKTVAPRAAAKFRAAINDSPLLKTVIQFNSLGAAGLIGAGVGSQGGDNR